MEKKEYDAVVVGAGPAGSSAAFILAKEGFSVALLEKENTVSETVRTSGVTWLDSVKEFEIPDDCYNKISKYSFCSPNNIVSIEDSEPRAAVLDVRKTYRWLAKKAVDKGAELFVNTLAKDVIRDEKGKICGVKATTEKKELEFFARLVIDASGFQSVVAKSMGFVPQWKRFGVGAEYEVQVDKCEKDRWWLMVGQKYSPAGYAWIFPMSDNIVRIGVGVGKPESDLDPAARLKEIIKNKEGPIADLGEIKIIESHYGLIPNEGLIRDTVYDNLILVGDSAGQANPLVLEGIRYAIRFGRLAGKISSEALKKGNTSKGSLVRYEEIWRKEIQAKINSALKVQHRWIGLSDEEWDKELDIISELKPEEFLDFIKADFGLSNMVKLATHHPKLAVRQLFSMIRPKK